MSNTLSWTNPTTNTDGSAYDPTTQQAGIDIVIDGAAAVSVPTVAGTSLDLTTVAAFQALKSGNHTIAIDVVNKSGVHSAMTGAVTFPIAAVPNAPTGLAVK